MKPRASDSAVPSVIPTPGITPQLRRVPAGTPLATPIVRILEVADGTAPAPRISHRRGLRTLLIALVATSAALAVAVTLYTRAARREEIENRYPIVAEGAAAQTIDRELARWSAGKPRLVRALTRFEAPALGSLVGAGACTLTGPGLRFTAGPDLAAEVSEAIDELLDRARRGRFGSGEALDEVVAQLSGPVTVAHGAVSYAFDPATGTLACAGSGTLRAVE
ncbi:MAG: hypothetical protein IPQ07_27990 [Myxococcales bacterium]|nr:hypothetical protein [Myxococcales bacterium]